MFLTNIKTSMGVHFVRTHEVERNAQGVWRDYVAYMETSSKADMQVNKLTTELTFIKLDTNSKGSYQDFIVNWQDKVRELENLTPLESHFPDTFKKSMLENSLQTARCFRDVKVNEQLEIAKGRGALSYGAYLSLVQNVAAVHDTREGEFKMRKFQSRTVRYTDLARQMQEPEEFELQHEDDSHDSDGEMETFNAYQARHSFQRKKSFLKREAWYKLSVEDKQVWDKLTDEGKGIIISSLKVPEQTNDRDGIQVTSADRQSNSADKINRISLTSDELDDKDNSILDNLKRGTDIPQSDINRLMSEVGKRNTSTSCNVTQYLVSSAHFKDKVGALVDRGANGGLAGMMLGSSRRRIKRWM